MIIPKKKHLSDEEYSILTDIAVEFKCKIGKITGETITLYPIIGDETSELMINRIEGLPFVDHVQRIQAPYKLMAIDNKLAPRSITAGSDGPNPAIFGGGSFTIIAGHCTIDPENQSLFIETAHAAKEAGADMLRGGVWKPRTTPHAFQGSDKSLSVLIDAKKKTGLPVATEVMDEEQLKMALEAGVDTIQIGARNALNYGLLKSIAAHTTGRKTTVLLKRSIHMGTVDEFISAAEYLLTAGNYNVLLCPRGVMPATQGFRNSPDESITLLLKKMTWAPVVVDPSHAVGNSRYVPNASLAAAAYGADGLLIETHIDPKRGIGDDPKQAVTPDVLAGIIRDARTIKSLSVKYLDRIIFLRERN